MITNGQVAYAEYARHRAQDGTLLAPWEEVPEGMRAAWEAFSGAVSVGADIEAAYSRAYMGAVGGKATNGSPAPCFAYLRFHRKDIAAAWAAAHAAARSLSLS